MKIYVDVIFFINFAFDFLLLFTVSIILKKNTRLYRILLGSVSGALSLFILFLKIDSVILFLFKVIISVIMIIITFGIRDFLKTISYLYFTSIILGGFIYLINNQFSYKVDGLIFINNGFSINLVLLLILSPIILYFYINSSRNYSTSVINRHKVTIIYKNKKYYYDGYLDSGNKLVEPYKNRIVSILDDDNFKYDDFFFIPYTTLSGTGIIKGVVVDMIIDDKIEMKNSVVGISANHFKLDDCQVILNASLKKDLH